MPDESDPPRKFYGLKPREFETVNALPRPAGENLPAADEAPAADSGQIRISDLISAANAGPVAAPAPAEAAALNDVQVILQENLARANAAGLNDVAPKPPRKSRRKRDFWLLLAATCVPFGLLVLSSGPRNPVPFVFGIAGLVLCAVGLFWIMWFVMEDY